MNQWRQSKRFLRRLPRYVHQTLSSFSSSSSSPDSRHPDSFSSFDPAHIRNFSIIAHVDHGKSTLADRLIEGSTGGVTSLPQQLDNLQVERERGITVKAQSAALRYTHHGEQYMLNLIDTPGHADFLHEVGRSLFLSDGAILLVDATQGIQAQTVSNFYAAFERDVSIIGAINKIDLPKADIVSCREEMRRMFDLDHVTCVSSKTGENVEQLISQIVEHVPPPAVDRAGEFVGVLHDCVYLPERGSVLVTVFIRQGSVAARDTVYMLQADKSYTVRDMGVFLPSLHPTTSLSAGQMGYILLKVKDVRDIMIGDTICLKGSAVKPLQFIPQPRPSIFSGVFPDEESDFGSLKEALEKLARSDTSITIRNASNPTLGKGWTLGFLGTLHREVFAQRLHQEFGESVVMTRPSTTYRAILHKNNAVVEFNDALNMPEPWLVALWEEPIVEVTLIVPREHLPGIISYCMECRGEQKEIASMTEGRFIMKYHIPLVETTSNFNSNIKRLSSGYASCDFEDAGYWETDLTRVDVLVNGQQVDGLSRIVRTSCVRDVSRDLVKQITALLPRQLYKIIVQCAVGAKIQARAEVKPLRKDVTKDLYGGDITRAMKLLKRQSEGKKKLQASASVKIPKDVFRIL